MATEQQHFQEPTLDVPSIEKWKSTSAPDTATDNISSGFDCNICLDSVHDPVVTLCGHLYCWPCIYKWLHFQTAPAAEHTDQKPPQPQCPVCKAEVSNTTLVPLYGRGQTTKPSESKVPNLGLVIPRRPPSPTCGGRTLITTPINYRPIPQLHQAPLHHRNHSPQVYTPNVTNPTAGMFGEMVYARVFGNAESNLYSSVYPNSYHLTGSSSPRVRRHIMEADKSLSRICFFLFCCLVLCLVLF